MNRILCVRHWIVLLAACLVGVALAKAADSAGVKEQFANPPRQYASAPLWVWNDMLTEDQVRGTLRDLAGQKVKQAFVHPRPGLMTPYLSPEWFRLWKIALDEAEKLDMNIWIYDENSYPSGFAGGLVPEAMPESRGRGVHVSEVARIGKLGDDVLAVFRLDKQGYENVTQQARAGQALPPGRYLVAQQRLAPTGGWFGGKFYVDLLKPGVTEKFIEITLEPYRREVGAQFGKRLPGVFTDEPHLAPAGGLHWSDNIVEEFQKRWGYSLVEHLPSLVRPVGDFKRVRHDYQQYLLEKFIERWARPMHEYCEKHGLEFTGHYWEHGWPGASHGPDNMAMYAWHQRPAIDILMNQYNEGVHAQFGNARAVKELSSVANQLGRTRTLCETYGAGGWDLRFEDMKRIGDWIYVLGVNTNDEHLSYITLRGARKRDHPQSFSYHEPWWDAYHVMAQYFTRLSLVMSSGQQVNKILVVEPTTTAWMYQNDSSSASKLKELGDQFQDLVNRLERQQVEYDLASEDIMARHGSAKGSRLVVGKRSYELIVLPPRIENLQGKTLDLLEAYVKAGGRLVRFGDLPTLVDGRPSDRPQALSTAAANAVAVEDLARAVPAATADGFAIRRAADDQGILFHHRRVLEDGEFLLLVNTSIESPTAGTVQSKARGVERWDLERGTVAAYPSKATPQGIEVAFELPPCGSLLVFLAANPAKNASAGQPAERRPLATVRVSGQLKVRRAEPNVLALDYVDMTTGGETRKNVYFYRANQMAFRAAGMDRNPWDSAVQFRDELISKKFPSDSGFEATYHFTIEGQIPPQLQIVIERPDLYTITCNGQPVSARSGAWWLDKAFGRIDIGSAAKVGDNAVAIKARPFTIYHELEPAYLLGDFSLKATDKGFVVVPDAPLALGPWNEQGHPMYAAGVTYTQTFDVAQPSGRYYVRLPKWYGSVAKVLLNGKPAGHIYCQPWRCDVTEQVVPGANTVEVTVIGTLKNTLGPHHGDAKLGTAWPRMFQIGPETGPPAGAKYHTVGYGLLAPMVIERGE